MQLHSTDYRRPEQLPDGPVLVVGGGNTGYQIAEELGRTHEVHLADRLTPDAAAAAPPRPRPVPVARSGSGLMRQDRRLAARPAAARTARR